MSSREVNIHIALKIFVEEEGEGGEPGHEHSASSRPTRDASGQTFGQDARLSTISETCS